MKVVKNTINVTLKVKKDELFEGKYLYYNSVSAKLKELEDSDNLQYKALRNKFYNSSLCGKYNLKEVHGLKCIDVKKPMLAKASLELNFEMED
jgi:hypothetical protein